MTFGITDDRSLVDPWLFHYYGDSPVLDLTSAEDAPEALARYGPEEKWERRPDRAPLVKRARTERRAR